MGVKFRLLQVLRIFKYNSVVKPNYCNFCNSILCKSEISLNLKPRVFVNCIAKRNFMSDCKQISNCGVSSSSNEPLPIVAHLDSPEFFSIFSDGLKTLQKIFEENNYELRLCGGAVRDLLLGNKPKDIDLATTATPDQMISMFNELNLRLINEGGWGHGTVTCRIEEENFEITTLRIDRVTDGRRAIVEFTTNWKVDAARRDLTFNSMFLTLSGQVIDYFNGAEDLKNRCIKFVGNAETRIQEDYLRILRFFRFFGRVADSYTQFDKSTMDIISKNVSGLERVSGERILTEMELIFMGGHVVKILKMMKECGLFEVIGLPNDADVDEFEKIYDNSKHLSPYYMTYVTALLPTENDLIVFRNLTKCSNMNLNISRFIIQNRTKNFVGCDKYALYTDIIVDYHREFVKKSSNANALDFFFEFLKYRGDVKALDYFRNFTVPRFPVSGKNVKQKTGLKGKIIGAILNELSRHWKGSRYKLNECELLDKIDDEMLSKFEV